MRSLARPMQYAGASQYLVILTSELICVRHTIEVENLAVRIVGRKAGDAAPERVIRSGEAMIAAFNGLREGGIRRCGESWMNRRRWFLGLASGRAKEW